MKLTVVLNGRTIKRHEFSDDSRLVKIGRSDQLENVVIDLGVTIPAGLVVGEDPELDAKRFRRSEKGICLITQAMIDRLES